VLYLDLETYSDIDLKTVGAYIYAKASELMLVGYALNDGTAKVWDATDGSVAPYDLADALASNCMIKGHNVGTFDRLIMLQHFPQYKFPIERWMDTQVLALTCGLPMGLDAACKAINMPDEFAKLKSDGRRLISTFCKPAPKSHNAYRYTQLEKPDEWADFIEYCRRDVIACRQLDAMLDPGNWHLETHNWHANLRMNDRGLPMDVELAEIFITQIADAEMNLTEKLNTLTDGKVQRHNQVARMIEWFKAEEGFEMKDMTVASVTAAIANEDTPSLAREVLLLRQTLAKSSVKKLNKIVSASDVDDAVHGAFEFYGAGRTGREAGRIIQPQNLPRTEKYYTNAVIQETIELLKAGHRLSDNKVHRTASNLIRAMIAATNGKELIVADLANIEGRVLAWLAGAQWKLEAFREYDAGTGPDLYKLAYAKAFNLAASDVDADKRVIGKVMELALGYQGALGAFKQMSATYGIDLPDSTIQKVVHGWRTANSEIVMLWALAQQACEAACRKPNTVYKLMGLKVVFSSQLNSLGIELPSKRILWYREMKQSASRLVFMGVDGYTKRWTELETYGGKLVENITQAVARDVLWSGVQQAELRGMSVVGTVHDEIICHEVQGKFSVDDLNKCMSIKPDWCLDLPLVAEGFKAARYRK